MNTLVHSELDHNNQWQRRAEEPISDFQSQLNVYCAAPSSDFESPVVSAVSVHRHTVVFAVYSECVHYLFDLELQKCFMDYNTSSDFPSTSRYHGWILIFGLTVPLTQPFSKWGLWTISGLWESTTGLRELSSGPQVDLVKYRVLNNKIHKLCATLSATKAM